MSIAREVDKIANKTPSPGELLTIRLRELHFSICTHRDMHFC